MRLIKRIKRRAAGFFLLIAIMSFLSWLTWGTPIRVDGWSALCREQTLFSAVFIVVWCSMAAYGGLRADRSILAAQLAYGSLALSSFLLRGILYAHVLHLGLTAAVQPALAVLCKDWSDGMLVLANAIALPLSGLCFYYMGLAIHSLGTIEKRIGVYVISRTLRGRV